VENNQENTKTLPGRRDHNLTYLKKHEPKKEKGRGEVVRPKDRLPQMKGVLGWDHKRKSGVKSRKKKGEKAAYWTKAHRIRHKKPPPRGVTSPLKREDAGAQG